MKRVKRLIARIIVVTLLAGVISSQKYPALFFNNSLTVNNLTLHSNQLIPPNAFNQIKKALSLLSQSEIYASNLRYNIFIVNDNWLYTLLGPDFTTGSFARTNVFNNVLIRQCSNDLTHCYSKAKQHNQRSLSGLIAHEITHINLRQKLGFVQEVLLPTWKKEGLADYIAQSSSYTPLENATNTDSKSYEYFEYRLMVEDALVNQAMSITDFLHTDLQLSALRDKVSHSL